jgi:hypothetical protein
MISREEFDTHTKKRFARMDANGDGFVTSDEVEILRQKRQDKKKNKPADSGAN